MSINLIAMGLSTLGLMCIPRMGITKCVYLGFPDLWRELKCPGYYPGESCVLICLSSKNRLFLFNWMLESQRFLTSVRWQIQDFTYVKTKPSGFVYIAVSLLQESKWLFESHCSISITNKHRLGYSPFQFLGSAWRTLCLHICRMNVC